MPCKHLLFVVIIFLVLSLSSSAKTQDVGVGTVDFTNLHYNDSPLFDVDVLVAASEPEGPISAVRANNGTIWIAINDTTISSGKSILFYKSTNLGTNWSLSPFAILPSFVADQVKLLKAGDSVYCFFRTGSTVYRFNVDNNSLSTFPQAVTQFDVVASSTNALYIFYSTATTVFRYSSIDGGFTWGGMGNVTANVLPTLGISATSDTLTVLYRAAGGNTTAITRFRYRETAAGTITTAGTSMAILTAGPTRTLYRSYRYGSTEWILYNEGDAPNTKVKCIVSTNGGNTYGTPFDIDLTGSADVSWFTAGISTSGSFLGIDLFFTRDSASTSNDKLMFTYSSAITPNFAAGRGAISEFPPVISTRNYIPSAAELGNSNVGVTWVGQNGANRNVYWDRFGNATNIHQNNSVANNYEMKQNYPNPFNPVTTISFSLPKSDFVSLKVFDIAGKEVQTILNKNLSPGSYDVNFDAGNLSSGVYFYTLITSEFTSTKKMMLIK